MYKEINPLYSFLSVQFCGVMYIHDVVLLSAQSSHINSSKLKLDPLNMNSYFLPPPQPLATTILLCLGIGLLQVPRTSQ